MRKWDIVFYIQPHRFLLRESIFPLLAGHILFDAVQDAVLLSLWQEHYWLSCNMAITITLNGAGLLVSHFPASTGVGVCSIPAAGLCTSAWTPQCFFTFLKVPWNLSSSLHLLIILNVEICLSHFEGMKNLNIKSTCSMKVNSDLSVATK